MPDWKETLRKLSETEPDLNRAVNKVLKTMTKDEMTQACFELMSRYGHEVYNKTWGIQRKDRLDMKSMHPLPGTDRVFAPPAEVRQRAWLVKGQVIHWETATADQHRERAAMRRKIAATEIEVAEMHEKAADEITAAGVTCLADLKSVQVAA